MKERKIKPWEPPAKPQKRKMWGGLKIPHISPQIQKQRAELEKLEQDLGYWSKGESTELENRHSEILNFFDRYINKKVDFQVFGTRVRSGAALMAMYGNRPWKVFSFDTEFVGEASHAPSKPEWKTILESIPNLAGQIIGGHTIVWGHCVSFKKFTNPVLNKYGDVLSENAGMAVNCVCGWSKVDILPEVVVKQDELSKLYFGNRNAVDYQLLEKVILDHIKGTFEEIDYIVLPHEFLEDINQPNYLLALMKLLKDNNAIVHNCFDTRSYIVVDDKMSDAAVTQLAEMLEGHPIGTRKLKVLRNV